MAGATLLTLTFEHASGIPENRVVWTFPLQTIDLLDPTNAELDLAMANMVDFLNEAQTTADLASYLSDELSRTAGAVTIRCYDLDGHLDGSAHGSPIRSVTTTLDAAAANSELPAECAVVLTTRGVGWESALVEAPDGADPGSLVDRPRQRLSGRNFIGPLNNATADMISNAVRVTPIFVTDLLDAAEDLAADMIADGWNWMVWSRVNAAMVRVDDVQVDNAFDTMRKRGPDSTIRTTRGV